MFGHRRAAVLGQPIVMIVPPRLREAHENGMRRLARGGQRRLLGTTVEVPALRAASTTRQPYTPLAEGSVSVNASARQLAHPAFLHELRETLTGTGLSPRRLTLEITESVLVEDSEAMLDVLRAVSRSRRSSSSSVRRWACAPSPKGSRRGGRRTSCARSAAISGRAWAARPVPLRQLSGALAAIPVLDPWAAPAVAGVGPWGVVPRQR
jgi:hypothetical protein